MNQNELSIITVHPDNNLVIATKIEFIKNNNKIDIKKEVLARCYADSYEEELQHNIIENMPSATVDLRQDDLSQITYVQHLRALDLKQVLYINNPDDFKDWLSDIQQGTIRWPISDRVYLNSQSYFTDLLSDSFNHYVMDKNRITL